jgi:hypothetical protein
MTKSYLLGVASVCLFASACSSDDATGGSGGSGGSGATGSGSRLSQAALDEMTALDVERYKGKAVITNVEDKPGGVKRVTFDPASGPICLRGSEYAAFYLDRGSDKTMILLDGGGACWSALCAADETADAAIAMGGPASETPGNYFGDWNLIFAPYCDGSVFSGDNDLTETDGRPRHHHGRQNLAAALDLAVEHFADTKQFLLGGFSAGGYGTIPGMVALRLLYPQADIFVMDDSGPGVQNPALQAAVEERLEEWKYDTMIPPSCTACDGGRGQLTNMFAWMLENDSQIDISVLSYFEDGVIGGAFNGLSGPDYKALLVAETGKVQSAYPERFKRFMVPGDKHVVTGGWASVTGDGVKVSDWVTAMAKSDDTVWKDLLAAGP